MWEQWRQMMAGRNGLDALNKFLLIVALFFLLLGRLTPGRLFLLFFLAALIWCGFRCFSRDIGRRARENDRYLQYFDRVRSFFSSRQQSYRRRQDERWQRQEQERRQRAAYVFCSCPKCGAQLRLPRGKGRIIVTCKKCGKEFPLST